jgi:hypothetical protein
LVANSGSCEKLLCLLLFHPQSPPLLALHVSREKEAEKKTEGEGNDLGIGVEMRRERGLEEERGEKWGGERGETGEGDGKRERKGKGRGKGEG